MGMAGGGVPNLKQLDAVNRVQRSTIAAIPQGEHRGRKKTGFLGAETSVKTDVALMPTAVDAPAIVGLA